ncbi:MAG: glycosyltransferase [Atopobiaceae bacterium]|nr:glycosyltransferase [Atopobiaceae bacterium]
MTRISVIIPVYNVEAYLDECLTSLEAQDFTDFEAICVNDGSPDRSRTVLARWEARVPGLRIVDKENGGVSSARNVGLDCARGDYVCFLDGDDRLAPQALGIIVRALDESGADVLSYGGTAFPEGASDQWTREVLVSRDSQWDGFDVQNVFRECQRTLILLALSRRLVEEGLRFDERLALGEDLMMRFSACARAQRVRTISDRLYEYRVVRKGSAVDVARKDLLTHRLDNLRVVDALITDYDGLGLLDQCLSELVSYSGRYVLVDALRLDDEGCSTLLAAYRETLLAARPAEVWLDACSSAAEREVLRCALSGKSPSTLLRRTLLVGLAKQYYGRLAALRTFMGGA